ncbi:MAG: M20/M25/M40 family metallo-hydrolase, partial [Thermoleophilaceae bacterium]
MSTASLPTEVELAQALIAFNTVNPPGNERACIEWLEAVLRNAGAETVVAGPSAERPSLVARVSGRGQAPPLLLQGHVDVVGVEGQAWDRDPFGGEVVDGELWGRGAIDMKGQVAVMLAAVLDLLSSGSRPAGDVILALVADEEQGGEQGARWLVEHRPELFAGVRHAVGEWGAANWWIGDRRVYPIQVDEKRFCTLNATFHGPAGHAALPVANAAAARLGSFLSALDAMDLPVSVGPVPRLTLEGTRDLMPPQVQTAVDDLLAGRSDDTTPLASIGELGVVIQGGLRNTVAATVVRGGEKFNVVPSQVTATLDCRLLPGSSPEDVISPLRELPGEANIEIAYHDDVPMPGDHTLLRVLSDVLREEDPEAVVVPYLLFATTDGRHFARLGIQPYGFTPLRLPKGFSLLGLAHAGNERVPVEALAFGRRVTRALLER